MADFNKALEYVIENEGKGFETWPMTDQPTNTGIIAADIADYRHIPLAEIGSRDVQELSDSEISAIYQTLYWKKMDLDLIDDQGIATCIMDTGVNRGCSVAVKYTQKVCNLHGGALVVDGVMGLRTISAIKQIMRSDFIRQFEALEVAGYEAILAAHPLDEKYRNGWMNRAKRLFSLIES